MKNENISPSKCSWGLTWFKNKSLAFPLILKTANLSYKNSDFVMMVDRCVYNHRLHANSRRHRLLTTNPTKQQVFFKLLQIRRKNKNTFFCSATAVVCVCVFVAVLLPHRQTSAWLVVRCLMHSWVQKHHNYSALWCFSHLTMWQPNAVMHSLWHCGTQLVGCQSLWGSHTEKQKGDKGSLS